MATLSYDAARARLLDACRPGPPLRTALDLTIGQYLAEPGVARFPLPRWRAASMDGFAVSAVDLVGAILPHSLRLVGTTMAGGPTPPPLQPGTMWRVATGGRLPPNADSVIRQEDVEVVGDMVIVRDRRDLERHVRPEGGDVGAGQLVVPAGTRVHAGTIATLAALGIGHPLVIRRPRVAVVASGDELADSAHPDAVLDGRRIADVNTPMLTALVHDAGGVPSPVPPVPDDPEALARAVAGATDADLVLTAGAVSVGPHDHVPAVMDRLGATLEFRRVLMRPGGPVTLARLPDGRPWLALPGNPVSAWTTFMLLARPAIRAMLGDPMPGPTWRACRTDHDVSRHPVLDLFIRVQQITESPEPVVRATGPQESWRTTALTAALGIIRVPAGEGVLGSGAAVDGMAIGG